MPERWSSGCLACSKMMCGQSCRLQGLYPSSVQFCKAVLSTEPISCKTHSVVSSMSPVVCGSLCSQRCSKVLTGCSLSQSVSKSVQWS